LRHLEDETVGQHARAAPDADVAVGHRLVVELQLDEAPAERNDGPHAKIEDVLVIPIGLLEEMGGEEHALTPYDLAQRRHDLVRSKPFMS
jgi:hypothetical protein